MCGICGELQFEPGSRVSATVTRAMADALAHRGPDGSGLFTSDDGRLGLGFRRLKILDLTTNADQPMANEDGAIRLVFNGEIYNFRELRRRLESRGHRFRSRSDSEVIVHLYEDEGTAAIDALDGMFALAIWDGRAQQLVIARDRAGKKPLYWYRDRRRLVFASEIKALLRHPEVPVEVAPGVLGNYFIHGYVPCPSTFYRAIEQVEPATVLRVGLDGTVRPRRYWSLSYPTAASGDRPAVADPTADVRRLVTEAVERRLISDVPLGAFLSGGIDSTIIVGVMSRLIGSPVKTFCIGFDGDTAYDETSFARAAAERFGADHTEFHVSPQAIDLVDTLVWHHDGPFGDSSAVPTYIVSDLTAEHVKVVLTGDGGDEVFAGYTRFPAALACERLPRTVGRAAQWLLARFGGPRADGHWLARARRIAVAVALPMHERSVRWSGFFHAEIEELLEPAVRQAIGPIDRTAHVCHELPRMRELTPLGQLLHGNFRSYLLDDLLVKLDRCTMANSLEARSPFLDRALVDYACGLPDRLKLRGWRTKWILKEAFADLLPDSILRRRKMGFGVPLDRWFRASLVDYVRDTLLSPTACYPDYLSRGQVERLVADHQAGRVNAGQQLWSLITFERWLRLLPQWMAARQGGGGSSGRRRVRADEARCADG